MNILRSLFRRLASSFRSANGTTGAGAASASKDYWLLVHAAMPRY